MSDEKRKALELVHSYFQRELEQEIRTVSLCDWGEENFYISDTQSRIKFLIFQRVLLNFMLDPVLDFQTYIYSSLKKSGKTTVSGCVARWIAETWGKYNEVFCMANDEEQARGRIYAKVQESIELDPRFDRGKRVIPDLWKIIRREIKNEQNGSFIRSVSKDNRGEAGSNPTGTFWSELWGYTSEDDLRLYEELTPVPTRPRSIRWIDSYAGYFGESELLFDEYDGVVNKGSRLTHADLDKYGGWPFADPPPIYVNTNTRTVAYWDEGIAARRCPWQTEDYYAVQAGKLRPLQFDRLHNNFWTSSVDSFLPIEWWDAIEDKELPPLVPGSREPVIIGVDASVSKDCTAAVIVSRHPRNKRQAAIRKCRLWVPPKNGKLNYGQEGGLKPTLIQWAKDFNVSQIAYDEFQLHHLMTELREERVAWTRVFSQNSSRLKSDNQLYDMIRDKELWHSGSEVAEIRGHINNAAAKFQKDEDSKMRIVKKGKLPIDLVIATSMALEECMRLNLS